MGARSNRSESNGTASEKTTSKDWVRRRETLVDQALEDDDLEALKRISALPGGFGSDASRKKVWPVLLNTAHYFAAAGPSQATHATPMNGHGQHQSECAEDDSRDVNSGAEHPDENQVLLDTKRSFVSYPKHLPPETKTIMQADLQHLIVGVLREYPSLSYFQGFHDIMSVLYLTYIPIPEPPRSRSTSRNRIQRERGEKPVNGGMAGEKRGRSASPRRGETHPEALSPLKGSVGSAERHRDGASWETLRQLAAVVSLCRIRDAMGKGLEGMMGLLRILKRVLKAADPELARFSSHISPVPTLPFFALSWILCLFSHDVDSLEPIQRMFDFLLARNPISAIYLAVAILVAKKPQMFRMAKALGSEGERDPSLLHPLFARLPPLYADTPVAPQPDVVSSRHADDDPNPYEPIPLSLIFTLTDKLMAQYPWDEAPIRGDEIMGEGSVVYSYEREMAARKDSESDWTLETAVQLVDKEVVKPGSGEADEDEEEEPSLPVTKRLRWRIRVPRDKAGTAVAVGIVLVGVGIAVYSTRAGGSRSDWRRWWAAVIHEWVGTNAGVGRAREYWRVWMSAVENVAGSVRDAVV